MSGDPFYASAAVSDDLITWTEIGSDSSNTGFRGTKLFKTNNTYWVLAGGATTVRVYAANMAYQGVLDCTTEGGTGVFPSPMAFPYTTYQVILTFDNSNFGSAPNTWGNLLAYTSQRFV